MIEIGHYKLIAYSPTHNQFLFRSTREGLSINYNNDVLFEGVVLLKLQMGASFYSIRLEEDNKKLEPHNLPSDCKLIRLESELHTSYIICRRVLIQENNLLPLESSIPIDQEKPLTKEDITNIYNQINEQGGVSANNFSKLEKWKVLL